MKEEAGDLSAAIAENFGDTVQVKFVDVSTPELESYPEISAVLPRVRLPLTVINGEPRFHGGISYEVVSNAIKDLEQKKQN